MNNWIKHQQNFQCAANATKTTTTNFIR